MPKEMTLPKIGVNMTEAVICEWKVGVGDKVAKDDLIMVAETDKALQEIFATDSGIVEKLRCEEGDTVACNAPIILLKEDGEESEAEEASEKTGTKPKAAEAKPAGAKLAPMEEETTNVPMPEDRVKISPLAKKTAKERGIDIRDLKPREEGKRIVKSDVPDYAEAGPTADLPPVGEVSEEISKHIPISATRRVISERMGISNREKPSAALTASADASGMIALIETYRRHGKQAGYSAFLAQACAKALKLHPILNARMGENSIEILNHINVGIAVDSQKGLVAPVIRDADRKTLEGIAADLQDKVAAIRENRSNPDDLSGGTFTVTNLGMFGVESFTAVINPPECAILAVGGVRQVFVPGPQGQPVLRSEIKMTLSFDHRIVDGAPAARFLQDVAKYVENPVLML